MTTTSVMIARSSCLRSRNVVDGALNTARTSAPARDSQASSSSVSRTGRRAWAASSLVRPAAARPASPPARVPGCGRRAGSPARPRRIAAGPGRLRSGRVPRPARSGAGGGGVRPFGVAEGLRGRGERGRFQDGEHLLEDPVLQPASAQALAAFLTAIQLFGRGRTHSGDSCLWCRSSRFASAGRTCRTAAGPAAARRPPAGAAAGAARGPPVLAQPRNVGFVAGPGR